MQCDGWYLTHQRLNVQKEKWPSHKSIQEFCQAIAWTRGDRKMNEDEEYLDIRGVANTVLAGICIQVMQEFP